MGFVKNKFKKVKPIKQAHVNGCWAACLEWYMKVVDPSKAIAQEVIRQQADIKKMYESDSTTGLKYGVGNSNYGVLEKHELIAVLRQPMWGLAAGEQPALQSWDVKWALNERGPIIIGFYDAYANGNHVNVICGFNEEYDMVEAMEPRTGKFVERGLTAYTMDSPTNVVAWRAAI